MWSNAPLGSASELGACASQERAWWFRADRGGLAIPGGRGQATWRSANASGARASRLLSRRFQGR